SQAAQARDTRAALPFLLRERGIFGGFSPHHGFNAPGQGVSIHGIRHAHSDLIPQPLALRGEIEVLAADCEAVEERDAAAGGYALVREAAGFKQSGLDQADLRDLAAYAVDLHPVADADAIFPYQEEPAEEGDDVVLKSDGEGGRGQADHGRGLLWRTEEDEHNQYQPDDPETHFQNGAQCLGLAAFERRMGEQFADRGIAED